jgi:N-acetylneuraminic acid mutarotase
MRFVLRSRRLLIAALTCTFSFELCVRAQERPVADDTMTWTTLPSIPDREGFAGAFAGVLDDALVVAGGANIPGEKWNDAFVKHWSDAIYILKPHAATWQTGPKLPHALAYGVSISFDRGLTCLGGSDATRHYADVIRFTSDAGTLRSTPLPPLPRPCANACGALLDHTIYIAGGIESPDAQIALRVFWALDLRDEKSQWRELEPWPGPGRMLAVAGVRDGSFFLMSGAALHATPDGKRVREYLRDAYQFTPGHGWKRIADLPRAAVAAPSPAMPCGSRRLLIVSGDDGSNVMFTPVKDHPGFPRNILIYDAAADRWIVGGETPLSRATAPVVWWQNAFAIPNGEVRPRVRTPEVWTMRCGVDR